MIDRLGLGEPVGPVDGVAGVSEGLLAGSEGLGEGRIVGLAGGEG